MASKDEIIAPASESTLPDNYLGALDIGSNSFHFVFARIVEGNLQILHSEKYQVKLASGLNDKDQLNDAAIERALNTLSLIAPLTKKLSSDSFRAVATFTLRQAANTKAFLSAASSVLPFDIEVISGHEEARLIYQGVAHYSPPNKQRLVIDIGGGSTECVVGKNFQTKYLTSLNIGCVSFYKQFFANDYITHAQFEQAIMQAKLEIESHVKRFCKKGWQEVLGTSGTMKAIYQLTANSTENELPINISALYTLKETLVTFGHVDNIDLPDLKESRRRILAPGLAIIIGLVEMLEIESFGYCAYSLREGVLYEQLEKLNFKDIRQNTVNSLSTRFNVDEEQSSTVRDLALLLLKQTQAPWELTNSIYHKLLKWAADLHEIGFDINPSAYHKHGKYILTHADLAGFNLEQQQALAYLVGNQRKKITALDADTWYTLKPTAIEKCLVILRLAVLLTQQRQLTPSPSIKLKVKGNTLTLKLEEGWIEERNLVNADLINEIKHLAVLGITLKVESINH